MNDCLYVDFKALPTDFADFMSCIDGPRQTHCFLPSTASKGPAKGMGPSLVHNLCPRWASPLDPVLKDTVAAGKYSMRPTIENRTQRPSCPQVHLQRVCMSIALISSNELAREISRQLVADYCMSPSLRVVVKCYMALPNERMNCIYKSMISMYMKTRPVLHHPARRPQEFQTAKDLTMSVPQVSLSW